jgi:FdhD protein
MTNSFYPEHQIHAGKQTVGQVALANEEPLHISLNGDAYVLTMRSADGYDEALARGLLFSEGIITDPKAPLSFSETMDPDTKHLARLDVTVPKYYIQISIKGQRNQAATSSCGICGTRDPAILDLYGQPEKIKKKLSLSEETIHTMVLSMQQAQTAFHETGGSHGAAAFSLLGEPIVVREDIGRHNAVDKVLGYLLNAEQLEKVAVLCVSGRISYEIVSKVYRAQIPILVAVSAPSSMAVETAEAFGITLVGFCRDEHLSIYTKTQRIFVNKDQS